MKTPQKSLLVARAGIITSVDQQEGALTSNSKGTKDTFLFSDRSIDGAEVVALRFYASPVLIASENVPAVRVSLNYSASCFLVDFPCESI